jgi:hypothetical protein
VVRRAAARVAILFCLLAAVVQFALGQTLARLTVESFELGADTMSPKIDVPFHLVLTLRVHERVAEVQNINLPILAELELLGDERVTASHPHGTLYRETITVVAHNAGAVTIAPATLLAIDARDGKAKEWYTNSLRLRVVGSSSNVLRNGGRALFAASAAALRLLLWLLLWILGIGCIAVIVLLLVRRRGRLPEPSPKPAPSARSFPERSQREQAQDALAVLGAQRSRAAAVAVRTAIWGMVGASDGETLGDVLQRPDARAGTMRQLLIALERSAFTHDDDLRAAIEDACSALERYIGSVA